MPYGEVEVKSLGLGEELASEPCCKRLKSTEEASVFSRDGGADSPRVQEKTGPDRAPAATSDSRGSRRPQEDESQAADLSRPLRDGMPQDSPDTTDCVGSQEPKGAGLPVTAADDGIYSTSKAFIGPIYQPPEKKGSGRRKRADPTDRVGGPAGREGKQTSDCRKSEIDSELFQFYKEIEELENDPVGLESSCQEAGPPRGLTAPCSQEQRSDRLGSEEEKGGGLGDAPPPHCSYQQHLGTEPGSAVCDGRVLPPFYDVSCVSFRPEWQSLPSFIMPRGPPPPLPGFDCHLDVQRFHVPTDPPSSVFRVHSDAQPWSGCYGDGCPGNWTPLAPDQSGPYAVCGETGSSALPPGGEYSAHDGPVLSGFCETREDCWEAPPVDQRSVAGALVDQRCPQENLPSLQKSLILLRGLPGSGKTTLSRVLLGQSRDGIVFSTDDYFRYQDGYRYSVDQLGDAHDWNQNRAKQAMAQGRSPVIIDNTNTQAWEMKPYVEMAIGKGYRVEFHEPETWWKFDPAELEKRNKHGVSRKKIAQMLERYEFHVSVAVVLNSVEPVHKGAQRPPPPWRPREGDWQETGHGLRKLRHKRNRRRNRAQANDSDVAETDTLGALGSRSPEALEASPSEEEDSEESPREPGCSLTGDLGHQPMGVLDVSDEESWGNTDPEGRLPDVPPALGLCGTPKNCLSKEGDSVFLSLSSTPGGSSVACPAVTLKLPCVTRGDCSGVTAEEGTENPGPRALGTQDRGADVLSSLMERKETGEDSLCRPHRSRAARQALTEQLGVSTRHTDSWALFPTTLSDKEWQRGSVGQPPLSSWPEGPHTFICEQRPKKERGRRRACPDGRGDLVELVSTPGGVSGSGSSLELSVGEKLWTEDENLSSVAENVDLLAETGAVSSHLPEPGSLPRASALMDTKRGQRITFSVAPNFDLQGPANNVKERGQDVPFVVNHGLEFVCGAEKGKISEINSEEDKEENHVTSSHHPVCFYLSFIKDAPLVVGGHFYACCLSFHRLGHAVCFYRSPVLSLGLPSFWKVSFMSKSPFLTSRSQTRVDNKQDDARLTSPELLHHQPDALRSLQVPSGLHLVNERVGEKLGKEAAARPSQSSPTKGNQASTRTRSVPTGLPLPQEFARQLVRLFGSPGIPMDSLSPEDFVVPLDQQTLKRLYLQWKVSVEKRQKKAA